MNSRLYCVHFTERVAIWYDHRNVDVYWVGRAYTAEDAMVQGTHDVEYERGGSQKYDPHLNTNPLARTLVRVTPAADWERVGVYVVPQAYQQEEDAR